jgi:hypothetical protein
MVENDGLARYDALGQFSVTMIPESLSLNWCGQFAVFWDFDLGFAAERDGWIVQEVTDSVAYQHCDKPPIVHDGWIKYEMFRVNATKSAPAMQSRSYYDSFTSSNHPEGSEGTHTLSGNAWFYYDPPGKNLGNGWPGGLNSFGDAALPTEEAPPWLGTLEPCAGVITHIATSAWHCCCPRWQTLSITETR